MKATISAALAASMLIAGCGGGTDARDHAADHQSLAALTALATSAARYGQADHQRRQALASSASSDAYSADLAAQLFNLAESSYTAYFPSKQASRSFEGWAYRYYPETDVYLAVIGSGVFVLGGPFGPEAVRVGAISDFVAQPPTGVNRPLTATILGQCPDVTGSTSPSFYACMTGYLSGTQAFDTAKSCRLEVAENGALTLSSDGKSGTVGPGFGTVMFLKNSQYGNFLVNVSGTGAGAARLFVTANPTLSFTAAGNLSADFTPAGSSTASISCKLNVPK